MEKLEVSVSANFTEDIDDLKLNLYGYGSWEADHLPVEATHPRIYRWHKLYQVA